MINFKAIGLEDRELINSCLQKAKYRNCDFSFANLFCWREKYHTNFAVIDGSVVIRYLCDDGLPCFMMPVGGTNANLEAVLQLMLEEAQKSGYRFRIHAVTDEMFAKLDAALPDTFRFAEARDYFEYLYLREDLAELRGKKYQSKRNHVNRFKKENPEWNIEPVTSGNVGDCAAVYQLWAENYRTAYPDEDLSAEHAAVALALQNFEALNLSGVLLSAAGKPVAFTYGQPLTDDTFCVHAEKALHTVEGAYSVINQEFVKTIPEQYSCINREEDLGLDSLRQAKLSYHPALLLRRGSVCLKSDGVFENDERICG